jgi:hypothetical protein
MMQVEIGLTKEDGSVVGTAIGEDGRKYLWHRSLDDRLVVAELAGCGPRSVTNEAVTASIRAAVEALGPIS